MNLFDQIAASTTSKKASSKIKIVQLSEVGTLEELHEKLELVKSKKKYVTYLGVARALGFQGKWLPDMTPVVLEAVGSYDALVVNGAGKQSEKVAASHRNTLESWGYTEFPGVKRSKKKDPEPEEVI